MAVAFRLPGSFRCSPVLGPELLSVLLGKDSQDLVGVVVILRLRAHALQCTEPLPRVRSTEQAAWSRAGRAVLGRIADPDRPRVDRRGRPVPVAGRRRRRRDPQRPPTTSPPLSGPGTVITAA